jgi:AraC-like DNA-binding protein
LEDKIEQPDFKSEDIDRMLGLSKSQTYRKIKSLTGIAPNQLIQEFRLRKSLKFLKQHSKTISETAYDLGFNSPAYFAKVFRKRFKITPTHFREISKAI